MSLAGISQNLLTLLDVRKQFEKLISVLTSTLQHQKMWGERGGKWPVKMVGNRTATALLGLVQFETIRKQTSMAYLLLQTSEAHLS